MSCAKPTKSTSKVVIYTLSGLYFVSCIWSVYTAFTGSAAQNVIGAVWSLVIAVLGIYGTNKENVCMLKAFAINVIILLVLTIIGGILILVGMSAVKDQHDVQLPKAFIAILIIAILLAIALHIAAAFYGFRLASLIQEETNRGMVYSGPPIHDFNTVPTGPPIYPNLKAEPLV